MVPKPKSGRKKPLLIKHENILLKIYSGTNTVNGVEYPQYTLVYHDGQKRVRCRFADLEVAKLRAKAVARDLAKGEIQALRLNTADRTIYVQAINQLRPLSLPLNVAVAEYVAAKKLLPPDTTLKEVVEFFNRRNPAAFVKKNVQQVADEMIDAKTAAGLSEVHLRDLRSRLDRFAGDFQMDISTVTAPLIQKWLNAMTGSARNQLNYLRVVESLFRFAIQQKYLPKEAIEEFAAIQRPKLTPTEVGIFTPAEMAEILHAARPDMIPWLAIAGFAGLRSAELQRLDWSEVNLDEKYIEIKAAKSKTAARRLAPITDNLATWLTDFAKTSGKVTGFASWWNQIPLVVEAVNANRRDAAKRAGKNSPAPKKFEWQHNALRHSFCSYRLAAIKNAAQVALEAGNSTQMIFKHYRQLVTDSAANQWFMIQKPHLLLTSNQTVVKSMP